MYALRERRVHVTQEDFELAVAKVNKQLLLDGCTCTLLNKALINIIYASPSRFSFCYISPVTFAICILFAVLFCF